MHSRGRLTRSSSHVPITGLALHRTLSGKLLALAGVDTHLIIYDDSGRRLQTIPVFTSQPIHGIHVCGATVLVWGSREVAVFPAQGLEGVPRVVKASCPDWICDAAVSPFDSSTAVLVTAHNELLPLRYSSGVITLGAAACSSRPMLFTARVVWESEDSVLVAGGTVFGHVLVWRCRLEDGAVERLFDLQGFEGSVFGVDMSPLINLGESAVRLLAACSDDRTVRVWDITERGHSSPDDRLEDLDTGFGGGAGGRTAPVAVAMGHASRIWGVKFGPFRGEAMSVYSFGEDAVAQRWLLNLETSSESISGTLSADRAYSLHHGKHLWSSAILVEHDGVRIATGGADSQINLIEEPVASRRSSALVVHDILSSLASPTSPAAAKEIISRYDFLAQDQILVTTSHGRLLLASLGREDDSSKWQEICVDETIAEALRSCYVLKAIATGWALLGTTKGEVYIFRLSSTSSLRHLATLPGKIVDMTRISPKSPGEDTQVDVVVFIYGQADSHLLTLDLSAGSLHGQEQINGLDPRFVATSAAMINNMIIMGSRHGWLSVLQKEDGRAYRPVLNLATPSFDTITAILPLPRSSANPHKASPYILTTSKDGKYRIYEIIEGSSLSLALRHETSPPFGPVIAGAWFTLGPCPELILYGFRSKAFVIWNETRKVEVANVDCGGAHRTFQFIHDDADATRYRLAFTKTSKLSLHSSEPLHRSLRAGIHGREIKALSASGRYVASGAEDASIWIWERDAATEELRCVATVKAHVTGIQRLVWCGEDRLFSSGGNEEFFAWRVRRLDSDYKGLAVFREATLADKSADGDLRITDFDVVAQDDEGIVIIITMALSDSTLKTYRYTSDDGGFQLLARGSYTGACLTQTRHLATNHSSLEILAASTDGHLTLWRASLDEARVASYSCLQATRLHQSSIKSLDTLSLEGVLLVLTGGDDNALATATVVDGRLDDSSRVVLRRGHAAAVTGVALAHTSAGVVGVSVGNDQMLKAWSIARGRMDLLGAAGTGVADAGDISLARRSPTAATVVVGGVGMETWCLSL